ncbi:MAG: YCF48-related protein [Pyrinomonadaceae bacterium]
MLRLTFRVSSAAFRIQRSTMHQRRFALCIPASVFVAVTALLCVARPASSNPPSAIQTPQSGAFCLPLRSAPPPSGAWELQASGTLAWLRAVYFVDEQKGWAVGGKGMLLATEDGGRTWAARRRPTEDALRDVYFIDANTGWLVCDRNIYLLRTKEEPRSYLLKTTDGGATWSRLAVTGAAEADVLLTRVTFADARRGWAFGEMGALFATTDGGATWARQNVPTRYLLLGGAFLAGGAGWLVGAGNTILQTSDGGAQWSMSPAPISATTRFNAVSFIDGRRGWAVGERGIVLATTDGGRSWQPQESNVRVDLRDVKFLNAAEGWSVGAQGTIIRTTDGGANWQSESSHTRHPLERLSVVNRSSLWAVGFGGTIIAYAAHTPPAPPQLKTPGTEQLKERPRRALRKETPR